MMRWATPAAPGTRTRSARYSGSRSTSSATFVTHIGLSTERGRCWRGGGVYRIDTNTAKVTTFCVLPTRAKARSCGRNYGLATSFHDCRHDQFFVTDLRWAHLPHQGQRFQRHDRNGAGDLRPAGTRRRHLRVAPAGERLWGVQVHGDRVLRRVWARQGEPTAGKTRSAASPAERRVRRRRPGDFLRLFVPSVPIRPPRIRSPTSASRLRARCCSASAA
jgi:hypothetical protein